MPLQGRNAVITGSTSGIGLGIARALAAEGCNIMLNGLPSPDCEAIRADLAKTSGVTVLFDPANMAVTAEVRHLVRRAESELGSVDILVNNAGIQHVSPIEDFPEEKLDLLMRINFFSAFHAIAAALPGMKARKFGRINPCLGAERINILRASATIIGTGAKSNVDIAISPHQSPVVHLRDRCDFLRPL